MVMPGRITGFQKPARLDIKDKKILSLLAADSRKPVSEIAKELRLSRDAVANRISRLKQGPIRAFVPVLDLANYGYSLYLVFLLLEEKAEREQQLVDYVKDHPNTRSVMLYTDTWDVMWSVAAKDLADFDSIMTSLTSKFGDIIIKKEILPIMRSYSGRTLPLEIAKLPVTKKAKVVLDELDKKILRQLSKDARQSSYDIGKALKVSSDTVLYRLKRLKPALSFLTIFDMTSLGYSWYTYALSLKKIDAASEAKFRSFIESQPHILSGAKVLGEFDVILNIVTDSTAHYHQTVKEIKNQFHDILLGYQTWLASEEVVYKPVPDVVLAPL